MEKIPIFGQRVTQMREDRGMTQQELAAKARTTYQTIWRIENGKHVEPGIYIAARIARALGVSLDYLTGMYDEKSVIEGGEVPETTLCEVFA